MTLKKQNKPLQDYNNTQEDYDGIWNIKTLKFIVFDANSLLHSIESIIGRCS